MTFHTQTTLVGLARAAVDARLRMTEYVATPNATAYLEQLVQDRWASVTDDPPPQAVVDTIIRTTNNVWRNGEPFVAAPAMTAIVAAAAEALDLTGDLLTREAAPSDSGILFLPEPIFVRGHSGELTRLAAITWATISSPHRSSWIISGWVDHEAADDSLGQKLRTADPSGRTGQTIGPYVLVTYNVLPIASPVPAKDNLGPIDDTEQDWQPAPDGSYVIAAESEVGNAAAIAYAFWCIQAQPLATVARPPLARAARRRAQRASIIHDTRVVMLRRTAPIAEPGDGEAKWHYRVRFFVKGHWRRLVDKDGQPYRIWIHVHIKGPNGAPLLHGEKVAVLAR
jgi:hypothetical protein